MRSALSGISFLFAALAVSFALAAEIAQPALFSAARAGDSMPAGWAPLVIPRKAPSRFSLVGDDGATVLRAEAVATAGMLAHRLRIDPATHPLLSWRWKVDHVLVNSELGTKAGDDFAARVYVFFDVPLESLAFFSRMKMRVARLVYGPDLPNASLCYVWDNKAPAGTRIWSPYSDRVQTIVLESGDEKARQWTGESRDVAADFRAAFGGEPPTIIGIAIGNDTDQTRETALAWFGDFVFRAAQ